MNFCVPEKQVVHKVQPYLLYIIGNDTQNHMRINEVS